MKSFFSEKRGKKLGCVLYTGAHYTRVNTVLWYFTGLRAHPGHHSHLPYMKILYSVWDATECEIFCPGYLSDLMVFWQHSYICMIVGEIGYRSFFSYHLSHNESNFLVALDVTHVLLNKITKSLLRSYCVVFNSTWENSWVKWAGIRCVWLFYISWGKNCRQNLPPHYTRVSRFPLRFFFPIKHSSVV